MGPDYDHSCSAHTQHSLIQCSAFTINFLLNQKNIESNIYQLKTKSSETSISLTNALPSPPPPTASSSVVAAQL